MFGRPELDSTLVEIQIIVSNVPSFSVVDPSLGIDPVSRLSQLLEVPPLKIRTLYDRNSKGLPLTFLEQRFHSFLTNSGVQDSNSFS